MRPLPAGRRALALALLLAGCGGAPHEAAVAPRATGPAPFAPLASDRVSVPPAPSACREPSFRAIPSSPVHAVGEMGEHDATFVLAGRLVVARGAMGATRAFVWDAAQNAWHDAGAGPITYREGDTGPFSAPTFLPAGDHVVMLWQNASQRAGVQGALLDVRDASWRALPLTDGPTTDALDGVDAAGRLVVFRRGSLAEGWRFDPRAGVWASVSTRDVPELWGQPTLVALGERVLVLGRAPPAGEGSVGALYDPAADTWTPLAPGPTPEPAAIATHADALFWWSFTDPHRGALYDARADAWQVVDGPDAPFVESLTPMPTWAFTGTHLVAAESHPESRARPRDPAAVYEVATRTWRHVAIPPTYGLPHALPDGRVVFFGRGSGPVVLDPRTGLVCAPDVSSQHVLRMPTGLYAFVGVIGDELVVWGRSDTPVGGPSCPPGAPCVVPPVVPAIVDDTGVAIRF